MTKTVNLNVRVQRIFSACEAHILWILHGNVVINKNMWHYYSNGENVIMTSSILAFSDDANTQKHVFYVDSFAFV